MAPPLLPAPANVVSPHIGCGQLTGGSPCPSIEGSRTTGDSLANNLVAGAGVVADAGGVYDGDGILVLTSTGRKPGPSNSTSINCQSDDVASRQVEVWIRRSAPSPFKYAIWADVGINMSSSSGAHSYDSGNGPYPGWGLQ